MLFEKKSMGQSSDNGYSLDELRSELEKIKAAYNDLKIKFEQELLYWQKNREKVVEVEQRDATLLAANPGLMFVFSRDGVFLDYSGCPNEMYIPPDIFLGKKVEQVLPRSVASLTHEKINRLFETGQMQVYDYELEIGGKLMYFESRLVRYGENKALAVTRNITSRKQAEIKLRESEVRYQELYNLLRLMADNTPDMIWAKDTQNRYIFANRSICENLLSATDTSEPIGKTDLYFAQRERDAHPDNPLWHTFCELCMDSDKLVLQELRLMQIDEFGNVKGKFLYLDVHKAPLYDREGNLIGVVGTARDITEKKAIEEKLKLSEETYKGIINSISEAVYIQDERGVFLDVNDTAVKLYGYPREYFIGKTPEFLSAPGYNDLSKVAECVIKAFYGEPQVFEFWGIRSNGEFFPKIVSLTPGMYFGEKCVIAVARDITQQKEWEQELLDAKVKAEENDRLKTSFLSNMSHEIRTPINGILGFVQLMRGLNITAEQLEKYLDIIEISGNRLNKLLSGLINLSSIESGQVVVHERLSKLNSIIEYVYDFFLPAANKKGISLEIEKAFAENQNEVLTDPDLLQDVLVNLVSNAIKYTSKGFVRIRCEYVNGLHKFAVSDSGIGIPKEKQEKIFDRFYRAHDYLTDPTEGAGLGLSIARGYVERLGGKLWVESEPDKGTVFYFTIPFKLESKSRRTS